MNLTEIKDAVIKNLGEISKDKELISEFMQNLPEIAKISKFIASHLRDQNIPITEKETLLDNETECNSLINFWVSLFIEYEKRHLTELANERFIDPFQIPD